MASKASKATKTTKTKTKITKVDTGSSLFQTLTAVKPSGKNDEQIRQCPAADMGLVPKHPFRALITGASGSGKTTLVRHLLVNVYKDYFDERVVFSPTALWDPAYEGCNLTEEEVQEELDMDELLAMFEEAEEEVKEKGLSGAKTRLYLFDDTIGDGKFMRSGALLKLFVRSRHSGISLMMLTQSYMKVARSCRLQADNIFFFPSNLSEVQRISEEHCPPNTSWKDFQKLVSSATRERYNFLYMRLRDEPHLRFRKNLDTVLQLPQFTQDIYSAENVDDDDDKSKDVSEDDAKVEEEATTIEDPEEDNNTPKNVTKTTKAASESQTRRHHGSFIGVPSFMS